MRKEFIKLEKKESKTWYRLMRKNEKVHKLGSKLKQFDSSGKIPLELQLGEH